MHSPIMLGANGHQALPQASHGANGHQALHQASPPVHSLVNTPVHVNNPVQSPVNTPVPVHNPVQSPVNTTVLVNNPVNNPVDTIVNSEAVKTIEEAIANSLNSSIREHLSYTLDNLLQEKLPRISKELSNNTLHIANNDEEIAILKEENQSLRLKVEGLLGEVDELKHRVNNQDKLIKSNTLQLSDISETIDHLNNSDTTKHKQSDVTLADQNTNFVHKESPTKSPNVTLVNLSTTPTHNVSFNPVTVMPVNNTHTNLQPPRSATFSEAASAHLGPPKAHHVPPPLQDTPVPDHNKEQLKIDLKKARRTIGISPINKEDLHFWLGQLGFSSKDTKDDDIFYGDNHEETRKKAAIDYISNWLLIDEKDIHIHSSKMAKDHTTNILWLNMEESEVMKLFKKASRVQNPKVKLHSFFPHQVWERKTTLQNLCFLERKKNPHFKFIIKPGVTDIELFTKQKGDPIWVKTNLKAYGNIPPVKFKFSPKEPLVPKLRQSETPSSKRKAVTPIKAPAKKHQGYSSPDHAFDDVMTASEDTEENLEIELLEADGKVNNNGD